MPQEKLPKAKLDYNGAPVRENYVKMQVLS